MSRIGGDQATSKTLILRIERDRRIKPTKKGAPSSTTQDLNTRNFSGGAPMRMIALLHALRWHNSDSTSTANGLDRVCAEASPIGGDCQPPWLMTAGRSKCL